MNSRSERFERAGGLLYSISRKGGGRRGSRGQRGWTSVTKGSWEVKKRTRKRIKKVQCPYSASGEASQFCLRSSRHIFSRAAIRGASLTLVINDQRAREHDQHNHGSEERNEQKRDRAAEMTLDLHYPAINPT